VRAGPSVIRALKALLLVLVVWGIYRALGPSIRQLTWQDLTRWRPAILPLLASFVLLLAVYIAHGLLWRRIMADLAIGRPTAAVALRVYFLSSLGRYVPGKLWQLAGLAVLARRVGLPPGPAAAAAVLGQFGFLTTGLLFLGLTLPQWRNALPGGENVPVGPVALGTGLLVLGSVMLWVVVATPIGHGLRERLAVLLGQRVGEKLRAAFDLADRVRLRDAAFWAVGYALSWLVLGLAFLLFAGAFAPAAFENARFVAGTVAASYLAGYVFLLAPAGIGVREGFMLILLRQAVPDAAAVVISVMSRLWFTAAELLPLALVPALPPEAPAKTEDTV